MQAEIARVKTEDAAAFEAEDTVGSFYIGAGINTLAHPDPPVGAAAQSVEIVVSVLGAEAAEDAGFYIGFAVAIGVFEMEEVCGLGDIDAAVRRE